MPPELTATGLYTKVEAMRLLRVGYDSLRALLAAGSLRTVRVGKRALVRGVSIAQCTGAEIPNVPAPGPVSPRTQKEILAAWRARPLS